MAHCHQNLTRRIRPGKPSRWIDCAPMKRELIEPFFATLKAANPSPQSELEYTTVFELLAAVRT